MSVHTKIETKAVLYSTVPQAHCGWGMGEQEKENTRL